MKLINNKTPYELLFGKPPTYNHLKVFGCLCYVNNHNTIRDKLDARASKCLFLGYPHGQKGWRVYDLDNSRIFTSRDAVFYEDIFPYATAPPIPVSSNEFLGKNISYHDHLDRLSSATVTAKLPTTQSPITDLSVSLSPSAHEAPFSSQAQVLSTHTPLSASADSLLSPVQTTHGTDPVPGEPSSDESAPVQGESFSAESSPLNRSHGDRCPPAHLKDYICHAVCTNSPHRPRLRLLLQVLLILSHIILGMIIFLHSPCLSSSCY